jgi:hypothetical protein
MVGTCRRAPTALIVASVLVAGCGGGSGKGAANPPVTSKPATNNATTTTKPSTVAETPQQRAADTALAKRAVLSLTDFPLGWTAGPHDNSGSASKPAEERKFLACTHIPKRFLDDNGNKQPNANSPDFSKGRIGAGPAAQISSSVEIDRSANDVSQPLSYLAAPRTVSCFDPFFRSVFNQSLRSKPGVSLRDFSFRALSVGSVGDQSAGFQGRVTVYGSRASIFVEFNLYFVRTGRAIVMLSAFTFSVAFDQSFGQALLEKMVGRLQTVS